MSNKLTRERWKTRRLMAWLSFWGIVSILPLCMLMDKAWVAAASGVIIAIITLLGGNIMVYITTAMIDDIKNK